MMEGMTEAGQDTRQYFYGGRKAGNWTASGLEATGLAYGIIGMLDCETADEWATEDGKSA